MAFPIFTTSGVLGIILLVTVCEGSSDMPAANGGMIRINSLGMEMVLVQPGSFCIGISAAEAKLPSDQWDEHPAHSITISESFYLSATEVTNVKYDKFNPVHRRWRGLRDASAEDDEAVTHVSW